MRNKWRRIILKATDGLLGTVLDLVLLQTYLIGTSLGKSKTTKGAYQMIKEAHEEFDQLNYRTIKAAFNKLKRQGFLRGLKEGEITAAGRKKLKSLLPFYDEKRVWDGSFYLITYDVPEKKRRLRDILRESLKTIGAAKLQESVWVSPYNPQKLLKEFAREYNLEGSIIVSCIGKDGYIGEESLSELINKVFRLEGLNERYQQFLEEFKRQNKVNKFQLSIAFFNILRDDPQLPWEILPDEWLGNKAYQLFKSKVLMRR